jgi:hypothetical protein
MSPWIVYQNTRERCRYPIKRFITSFFEANEILLQLSIGIEPKGNKGDTVFLNRKNCIYDLIVKPGKVL